MFILGMLTMYFTLNIIGLVVEMVKQWDNRHKWRLTQFISFIFLGSLNMFFE